MDWSVEISEVGALTRNVKVAIASGRFSNDVKNALSKHARTAQLKGFRPGKAPLSMIEKLYGERIQFETAQRLIDESFSAVVQERELAYIGDPNISIKSMTLDQGIEYTAEIELYPRPEIKDYSSFKISVAKRSVTEAAVDQVINRLREQRGKLEKVESRDVVQERDVLNLEVTVTASGEADAKPEPAFVQLGRKQLPEEIEQGLVGCKLGQTKSFELTVPATHHVVEMRGKKAKYEVLVKEIYAIELPELNDEFVQSASSDLKTVAELRERITADLQEENERQSRVDAQTKILDLLVDQNQFEVPARLVDQELRTLVTRSGALDVRNMDRDAPFPLDDYREAFGEMARKRVQRAVIVDRICELEKIEPGKDEIQKGLGNITESGMDDKQLKDFFKDRGRVQSFVADLRREMALDLLFARAQIEYTAES